MHKARIVNLNDWSFLPFSAVPIGKRVKNIAINPLDNTIHYFKEPEYKYPWEHWTEITASKIGAYFKFNVLDYNIGYYKEKVGCLSPSMVTQDDELIHGQQFLTQINPKFEKKKGTDHTFQLIMNVFGDDKLQHLIGDFLKMLVYDAIIGNRDRHQQNWGFIRSVKVSFKKDRLNAKLFTKKTNFFNFLLSVFRKESPISEIINNVIIEEIYEFTPYFDNGNCLAYNITNDSLALFLNNNNKLNNYAFGTKATSHIKWNDQALPHVDLLRQIKGLYPNGLKEIITECIKIYSEEEINRIIYSVDDDFDNERYPNYQLTLQRKEIMAKLIKMRMDSLNSLI